MHLHCNDLGMAGNATTTLETMRALEGHRAHFAHLQFHCYGGERGGRPTSRAREIAEELHRHPNLSADVGQVIFGPATTMTADSRVGEMLHDLTGHKWVDADLELEGGCGIVPYEYRERNAVHATQWAVGLELLLLSQDPWRLVLSTDHPNGGTFLSYPRLIRWLMDKAFRDEQIRRLPPRALEGTALADGLQREYTLSEIAVVTRAGPARLLGLGRKGHLGPGADADVALYAPDGDREAMFARPRYVFKGGVCVAEDGQIRREVAGRTLQAMPGHDPHVERGIRAFLEEEGTLDLEDYVIGEEEIDLRP
jgi:formylmethanofuran dehydrogenase subunit A